MGGRRLLKEGVLTKSKSGRKLRAFLCNDILVLTEEAGRALYRMVRFPTPIASPLDVDRSMSAQPIPLSEVDVRDVPGGRGAFHLKMGPFESQIVITHPL